MAQQVNVLKNKKNETLNFELSNENSEPVKTVRVFIAAIAVNFSAMAVGTGMGWTSPTIPKLKENSTEIRNSPLSHAIDTSSEAWISSIMAIGAAITPFIATPLADRFGRKKVLLSSAAFFILAYMMLMFASKIWIMLLARLIKGFGIGFVMSVVPMYVGEIAADNVRGALGSLMSLFIGFGIYAVLCVGPFVNYVLLQCFCISIPIVFFIAFSFMPESPYFSIAKGKKLQASQALQFFRGQSQETVENELTAIETMVQTSMTQKGGIMELIKNSANRRALLICLGLILFQQVSGINAVLFNSQSIFDSANMGLSGAIAAIIVCTIQIIAAAITPLIADRFGRKEILMVSAVFMGLGQILLGSFFFMKDILGIESGINWLPLPSLVLYIIMFVIGYGPMPWTILGEMFAPHVKPMASSLFASLCWLAGFFVALVYPSLQALGVHYAFWLFGFLCFPLAFMFALFFVMETRGLSLQEIQNRLNRK